MMQNMFGPGMMGAALGKAGMAPGFMPGVMPGTAPVYGPQNMLPPAAPPGDIPDGTVASNNPLPDMGKNGPSPFKGAAPNYTFSGSEDSLQAVISNAHIGIVLMGTACLLGGCIGMTLAGPKTTKDDDSGSDDE